MNSEVFLQPDPNDPYCTPEEQLRRDQEDQKRFYGELEAEGIPELDEMTDEDDDSLVEYGRRHENLIENGIDVGNGFRREQEAYTASSRHAAPLTNGYHRSPIGKLNGHDRPDDRTLLLSVREREIEELKQQLCEFSEKCQTLQSQWKIANTEKEQATLSAQTLKKNLIDVQENYDKVLQNNEVLQNEVALQKFELDEKDKMLRLLQNASQEDTRVAALERQIQGKDEKHRNEVTNLNGEYQSLFKKYKQLQTDNLELEMKVKTLKDSIDDLTTEKSTEITRLLTEKNILEDELRNRADSVRSEHLNTDWKKLEEGLRSELAQKEVLINTLRVEIMAKNECGKSEPVQIEMLRSRINELERKLYAKEEELVKLTILNSRTLTQEDITQQNADILRKRLEDEKEFMQGELAKHKAQLAEKDSLIEVLKTDNENVKREYLDQQDIHDQEKKILQEKIDALNESLVDLQTNHSRFCQKELENKAREIDLLKAESETKSQKLDALRNLIETTEKANSLDNEDVQEQLKELHDQRAKDADKFEKETYQLIETHQEDMIKLVEANRVLKQELIELNAELDSLRTRLVEVHERRDAGTSPAEGCMMRSEVMTLMHAVAVKHEQQVLEYESKIVELSSRLQTTTTSQNAEHKAAVAEPQGNEQQASDLLVQLWKKYEDLAKVHGQQSDRVREAEAELARALDETDTVKERLKKIQSEYFSCLDKYNKLKVQTKHYRGYFEDANKKLKDELQSSKKIWEKDRTKWEKAKENWHTERMKREKSLLEVLEELQKMKLAQPPDAILQPYNDEIKRLKC